MAQTQRPMLADRNHTHIIRQNTAHLGQQRILALGLQQVLQLELGIEVVFYGRLGGMRYKNDVLDPCSHGFLHHVFDGRPIHNGQHFLGNGLGRRQHARTEARHR